MRFIAWTFAAVAGLMLLIAVTGESWIGALLALGSLLLMLPPLWDRIERPWIGAGGRGYGCTEDCGGHDAGHDWAEEQGIEDEGDCGGKSWSFEEGCVAYVEGQQASAESDDL